MRLDSNYNNNRYNKSLEVYVYIIGRLLNNTFMHLNPFLQDLEEDTLYSSIDE